MKRKQTVTASRGRKPRRTLTRTAAEHEIMTLYRQQSNIGQRAVLNYARLVNAIADIGKSIPTP